MAKPMDIDAELMALAREADQVMGGTSLLDQVIEAIKGSFTRLPESALRQAVEQYLAENPKLKTVEDVVSALDGRDLMSFRRLLARVADETPAPS